MKVDVYLKYVGIESERYFEHFKSFVAKIEFSIDGKKRHKLKCVFERISWMLDDYPHLTDAVFIKVAKEFYEKCYFIMDDRARFFKLVENLIEKELVNICNSNDAESYKDKFFTLIESFNKDNKNKILFSFEYEKDK